MSTQTLTPGKCTAISVLGGVVLAAVSAVIAGGASVVAPAAALGGVLGWLGGVAGNQVQSWFGSKLKNPPPNANEIFHNHHISQLLSQAIISTVEQLVPLAKEKLGGVSQTLLDSGKTLATRLNALIDSPSGILAEVREFNVSAILTEYATKQGRIELFREEDWKRFIDEEPALNDLKTKEREMLVYELQQRFGEALWNLVKHDAATDRQAFAAVELLYLSHILETVQTCAAASGPPDLSPIIVRISSLLKEIDQEHIEYFHSVLTGISALTGKFDEFFSTYRKDRKQDDAFQAQTKAALAALAPAILNSNPVNQYLANLTRRYSIHNTFGLPAFEAPGQKQEPDRIEDLFVQPTCTSGRTSPEAMEAAILEGKNPASELLPLLEKERRVVLLADPGMGKSTLVQWLVVALAAPHSSAVQKRFERAIPFPFLLRDIVPVLGHDLSKWTWQALMDAFLAHKAGGSAGDPALAAPLANDPATLRSLLESPQAWFLLDGLDEIGDPIRRLALQKVIWEGFDLYPNARWLITSRVVGYDEAMIDSRTDHEATQFLMGKNLGDPEKIIGAFSEFAKSHVPKTSLVLTFDSESSHVGREIRRELCSLHYLAPWDDIQQQDFSQHWFSQRLGAGKGAELSSDFLLDVRAHASTRVLGRVPNLLLLMSLLYRYRAHLPNGRALVYQGISQAYLEGIPLHRKIPHRTDKAVVPYTFAEKERLLAIIAMHMMNQRMTLISQDDIVQENVGEILASESDLTSWLSPEFGGRSDQDCAQELQQFLQHIAESSGLLLPRAPSIFGFAHLSFQEYYAACYLKLEFERLIASGGRARRNVGPTCATLNPLSEEDFEKWAAMPIWREPLLFLVELLKTSEPFTAEIMAWLFPTLSTEQPTTPKSLQAQRLLATLSIDSEVALADQERHSLWEVLIRAHLGNESAWNASLSFAPALLERSEYQNDVLTTLVSHASKKETKAIYLAGCTGLCDLLALKNLQGLKKLYLNSCTSLSDLSVLGHLPKLETLDLRDCTSLNSLGSLRSLHKLKKLSLFGCTGISDISALNRLHNLNTFELSKCINVSNLGVVSNMVNLKRLFLNGCIKVSNLSGLSSLNKLQTLSLHGCIGVSDLSDIKNLVNLKTLFLRGCTGVRDLSSLQNLSSLETLDLSGCAEVKDFTALQGMSKLRYLELRGCTGLSDLAFLHDLSSLRTLNLKGCTSVTDFVLLKELHSLKYLDLKECTSMNDLSVLYSLTNLHHLELDKFMAVNGLKSQIKELNKALPNCTIFV